MEKDELIIKAYLRKKSKVKKMLKVLQKNDKYYEQQIIPFYKRVHTFI